MHPFGYFKIAGAVLTGVLMPLSIAYVLSPDPAGLHAEGGIIEWLSFGCWIAAIVICCTALFRRGSRNERLAFWWCFMVSALAAARELDAQVLLNPEYLGPCGVHYMTRWFLSPEASIYLRLSWFFIFLVLGGILISPLIIKRTSLLRRIRSGDNTAGFFLLSIIGLATGFLFDDTLRKTAFLDTDVRQAIEEIAELLGVIFFLMGTGSLSGKTKAEHKGPR